jgi:5S rRNA maturation endonuclease (ribonuclease M5)
VIPAYDHTGAARSIHARAIDDSAIRKTTWPQGVDSKGLFFADPRLARPMLRGKGTKADKVLICEGLTDYLWSVQSAPEDCAVIGIASGSIASLNLVRWPSDVKIYIGADPDAAGDRYASEIAASLSSIPCRRIPLHTLRTSPNGHK